MKIVVVDKIGRYSIGSCQAEYGGRITLEYYSVITGSISSTNTAWFSGSVFSIPFVEEDDEGILVSGTIEFMSFGTDLVIDEIDEDEKYLFAIDVVLAEKLN